MSHATQLPAIANCVRKELERATNEDQVAIMSTLMMMMMIQGNKRSRRVIRGEWLFLSESSRAVDKGQRVSV